ncbi:GNAT family acetyltransferase [Ceratobasidium sp. AG-Ba]|nr:GNAT family acetyltransferase [Ceratobasidium sp. AG-Ba]
MSTTTAQEYFIRPVHIDDIPALSQICLLTAEAGQSAEALHKYPELLGLLYIEPYVKLSPAFGFVLVSGAPESEGDVVGYFLATPDTRAHEATAEENHYPPLRVKYPNDPFPSGATAQDQRVIGRIHNPMIRPQGLVDIVPAHMHINILPQAQRQGWGVRLIDTGIEYLKDRGQDGLFLGIDSRNHNARAFYTSVGFKPYPFPDKEYFYLKFDDWKGVKARGMETRK